MCDLDKSGVKFCQLAKWLGYFCASIGLLIAFFATGMGKLAGAGMAVFGAWGAFSFSVVLAEPAGLSGWKLNVVTPALERSIRRDILADGTKESYWTLHAAKQFMIFCSTSCLTWGLFGVDGFILGIAVGIGCAWGFDTYIYMRAPEEKKRNARED